MPRCAHEKLLVRGISVENVYLQCCICKSVISLKELIEENLKLKNLNEKYSNENIEVKRWIREIEGKNDKLQKENEALKHCLKNLI